MGQNGLSGWMVVAHLWLRSIEYGLRGVALLAGGLVLTMDAANPNVGWLDFGAAFSVLVLTAIVCWKLAEGMAKAPRKCRTRRQRRFRTVPVRG